MEGEERGILMKRQGQPSYKLLIKGQPEEEDAFAEAIKKKRSSLCKSHQGICSISGNVVQKKERRFANEVCQPETWYTTSGGDAH